MFFRGESFKDFLRFYPVVSAIIALQVVVWAIMYFNLPYGREIYYYGIGQNLAIQQGDYWRILTPIFMHDVNGITHILFNSFALVLFGPALETMLGKFKFIFLYLGSGIFANLFTYLIDTDSTILHLGASGAIYALLGFIVYLIFFVPGMLDPVSRQIALTYTFIGIIMTFIQPGVSIPGHVFGLVGGFAFGPILANNLNVYRPQYTRRRKQSTEGVNFDPNRWNKRRRRLRINPNLSAILWWVIIILAALGFIATLIF